MPLTPGTRIGVYEVLSPLGAGGMGEVFRARDTRLQRDVAIKALPAEFARDPERLSRFEREAKLLASVTHPHIAGIFGLEESEGHRYLVLEFVEGETLAQRLDRGPLPIGDALQIARQVAAALESAHESGVAHRDLKPGNVMITPAGDAKVLDFGLAKGGMGNASSSDVSLSHSPTMTHGVTGAGVILGTAAYMSPEQARGRTVDKRTDIWSFGCVLFECLTGRQAFSGDTVSDMIARILEREPEWDTLPARTPDRVRDLLRRCLEKDARKRLRDIGDARIELDEIIATRSSNPSGELTRPRAPRVAARTLLGALALVVATAAATALLLSRFETKPDMAVMRFDISEMPGTHMDLDGVHPAISPNGRMLAYNADDSTGTFQLWVRPLESLDARRVPGTDDTQLIFWSPDSRFIGYFDGKEKLMKVAAAGGVPERICNAGGARGASWGRDDVIVLAPVSEGPIHRVSANGGESVPITTLDSTETAHRFPHFLPDGKRFLYSVLPPRTGKYRIYLSSVDGNDRQLVLDSAGSGVVYAEPGYLIYQRDDVLVAHPFDAKSGKIVGEPISLGDRPIGTGYSGGAVASTSRTGLLTYTTPKAFATHLVWADLNGKTTATIPMVQGRYFGAELSPDNRHAVLESATRIGVSELWMADLERGVVTRLSYEKGENTGARWSPDGTRVIYECAPYGDTPKFVMTSVGVGASNEEFLADDPAFKFLYSWTPDGRAIIYGRQESATRRDIWILPLDGDRKPIPYLVTPYSEEFGKVSPDGRWMAYQSDESGRPEVYVQSFPVPGAKYQVTTRGGFIQGWSHDGKQLYFGEIGDFGMLMAADVIAGPTFRLGPTRAFVRTPDTVFDSELAREGDRQLMLLPARELPPQTITIVQNWASLLKGK